MGYSIYQEYVDIVSGAKENRPQFELMMKDAAKRNLIWFFSLHLTTNKRRHSQTIHYLQMLDDFGVTYKSYSEQYIDSSGIFKDVIIALLSTLAKQERLRISERVKAGLEKSRQQGRIGGRLQSMEKRSMKSKNLKHKV